MLSHADVWRGVDRLAEVNGLSASGLAKRSGLDPTTFNKSKRATRDGRPRWPSTESLSKILDATHTTLGEFVALVDPGATAVAKPTVPCVRLGAMTASHFDASGFPTVSFDRIDVPHLEGPHLYAIEIDTDAHAPTYRAGDTLLVAPDAGIRRGDRVVLMPSGGPARLGIMRRRTTEKVTMEAIVSSDMTSEMQVVDLAWMARIVWASQ